MYPYRSVGPVAQSVLRLATGWTVRGSSPSGGEIFRTCPDRTWGLPILLYNGYRFFPGGKERPVCDADPPPLLVPWSRKSRAIPLLALWAVRPVQRLSACTRVHFTFTFIRTTLFYCNYWHNIVTVKTNVLLVRHVSAFLGHLEITVHHNRVLAA